MRISIALAIYVSLAAGAFAQAPGTPERTTANKPARSQQAKAWQHTYQTWRANPAGSPFPVIAAGNLAGVYRAEGNYTEAERLLREAQTAPSISLNSGDLNSRAMIQNALADLLREEGKGEEARQMFRASLQIEGLSWQPRMHAIVGLADCDRTLGDREASEAGWNEALKVAREHRDDQAEAIALRGLAMLWVDAGNLARAEPLLRRSLKMMENNPSTPGEQLATALFATGELYRTQNKLALAEDAWSRALQIERTELGDSHPQVASVMVMLADVYSARGESGVARDYATRASEIMRDVFGDNSIPAAAALANRAMVEQRANNLQAAADDYERALGIAQGHPESRSIERVMMQRYALLLKAMHRGREAKALDAGVAYFRPK